MDIVAPANWAEARLDTFAPGDRAPLQAIQAALQERFAVAKGVLDAYPDTFRGAVRAAAQRFEHESNYGGIPYAAVIRSIWALQAVFYSDAAPYASSGYTEWPRARRETAGAYRPGEGINPYEALATIPPPAHPAPGDSTAAALTRAFYAWCRDSIDAMTTVPATWMHVNGRWKATGSWENLSDMLADAELDDSPGKYLTGGVARVLCSAGGVYDVSQRIWWKGIEVPCGVSFCNRAPLAANARLVVRAIAWPGGEWDDSRIDCDWIFGGFGLASAPGPSSSAILVAPGEWGELIPDLGACPAPGSNPPAWPGPVINWNPPAGGGLAPLQTWSIGCEISALLDYTPGFRFKADEEEDE